ncbi:MAG: hypothetical protein ACK5MG_01340 [Bacteroidales bacterium]
MMEIGSYYTVYRQTFNFSYLAIASIGFSVGNSSDAVGRETVLYLGGGVRCSLSRRWQLLPELKYAIGLDSKNYIQAGAGIMYVF